jgi:hypothetical protein
MGRKQSDENRYGCFLDLGALYQVGNTMLSLARWPMGQWELGLNDPAENFRGIEAREINGDNNCEEHR